MFVKKLFLNSFLLCILFTGTILSFSFKDSALLNEESLDNFSSIQEGDIVFQISQSGQGKAIQLATHSKYTHCGLIFKENNDYIVYEAVQPVKKTLLKEWIKHGEKNSYEIRRLKKSSTYMTPQVISKMKQKYKQFEGKNYDLYFEWSDDKIYCSELVWKIYKGTTGLEVGKLQKLKEFDLSPPFVKAKLQERYGSKIPYEEMVISPAGIFESDLLIAVRLD
jgi:hypothetical protein